jgi:cell division protein FtsB
MKWLTHLPPWLKNKYLLTGMIFLGYLAFFDDRDLLANYHHHKQLKDLEQSAAYYRQEIEKTKSELNQLKTDAATLEKYAREKYLMKRDNEDIFIIRPQPADDRPQ